MLSCIIVNDSSYPSNFSITAGHSDRNPPWSTSDQKSKVANCITVMVDLHTDPAYLKDEDHRKFESEWKTNFNWQGNQKTGKLVSNNTTRTLKLNQKITNKPDTIQCTSIMRLRLKNTMFVVLSLFKLCAGQACKLWSRLKEVCHWKRMVLYNKTAQIEGENRNSCYMGWRCFAFSCTPAKLSKSRRT